MVKCFSFLVVRDVGSVKKKLANYGSRVVIFALFAKTIPYHPKHHPISPRVG